MNYSDLVTRLNQRQLTISCAESLTGGQFQSHLTQEPAAGNVYVGGFITYATAAKHRLLDIPEPIITQYGVVSHQAAWQMAQRAKVIAQTDIGISFTGVAGPDRLEDKPVGTVYIGLVTPTCGHSQAFQFDGDSSQIVHQTCQAGIALLLDFLAINQRL
ncbi:CinA family protein [Lacticaseibacillus paracasei]|uniref:CinA family protein n=1 Tax=Lacticaseibacillus paracasei TaxID=1597 RepID=UPI0021A2EBB6|nr:CinA family protein [Lacticaseibacillus paracasei]MCT4383980.1 CinA family protein [Lacticaseibacillus paracasei]